ncbi:unnamed protein product [Ambrosiozyma monospora]|uniref:Unnamed protein product n=1 Tax=Ambrosiozyma monospora TaxID=43982 RepID=A0A9W7DFR7_AMBMO|nr:unnamed protein product [Ambrosiozyma monospora]
MFKFVLPFIDDDNDNYQDETDQESDDDDIVDIEESTNVKLANEYFNLKQLFNITANGNSVNEGVNDLTLWSNPMELAKQLAVSNDVTVNDFNPSEISNIHSPSIENVRLNAYTGLFFTHPLFSDLIPSIDKNKTLWLTHFIDNRSGCYSDEGMTVAKVDSIINATNNLLEDLRVRMLKKIELAGMDEIEKVKLKEEFH